ncbi:MAG TPA: HEAT repeat domain-containing protein [Candidatus Ozemobacteraceae bacterium]|mgnify:CR=1 FL=1|nr:HEAT repeat domain-containing protein [Candidatus Ozemobacteraceae bacterium]
MTTSRSDFGTEQIRSTLKSGDGSLILSLLNDIESAPFSKQIVEALQQSLPEVREPVLEFQVSKTIKLQMLRMRGNIQPATVDDLQRQLTEPDNKIDFAITVTRLESSEAFLAADLLRSSSWNMLAPEILPTLCHFFTRFGNIQDSDALTELCRHPNPSVLTAAIQALEIIDPDNLQSLVTPLLNNPIPGIRAQAIKSLYRWDKPGALRYLVELMFSPEPTEKLLAIHHAAAFPYAEIEPHLLRFITEVDDPRLLIRVSLIMKSHAHPELPFKLYWICRNLRGQHQNLVKGILLGVARTLADTKIISISAQEYLDQLKIRVKAEEDRLLRDSMKSIPVEQEPTAHEAPATPHADHTDEASLLPDLDSPAPSGAVEPDSSAPRVTTAPLLNIDDYDSLDPTARIQLLNRISLDGYKSLESRLPALVRQTKGKELGALIKLIGRFGSSDDAQIVKPYLSKENPDEVSAAIDALAKLDSEYLCIYLPQLMQHKNGKIRMNATRAFVGIDRNQIKSLVSSLLLSNSLRQRALGIPAATLVDFSLVREPLIKAFQNEANPELIEKIGLILGSNPDREILHAVSLAVKTAEGTPVSMQKKEVLKQVAEKLSIALDKISTPEELLAGELPEQPGATDAPQEPSPAQPTPEAIANANADSSLANAAAETREKIQKAFAADPIKQKPRSEQEERDTREHRAKMTVFVWILVGIVWGAMIVSIIYKFLFGS